MSELPKMPKDKGGDFVNGLVWGGVIGLNDGLKAALRSGEEVGTEIAGWARTLRGQVETIAEQVRHQLRLDGADEDSGSQNVSREGTGFFNGFLLGEITGFIAGVVIAPHSAEEVRSKIGDWARTLRGQAGTVAEQVRHYLGRDRADEDDDDEEAGKRD